VSKALYISLVLTIIPLLIVVGRVVM
jgi:hypothetical protein